MRFRSYPYQDKAIQWVKDHPRCGLFLDMGLGKTVSTLTAIQDLMDDCDVIKTLVVAPKKVAETTWTTEANKWDHLRTLRVSKVLGSAKQRIEALNAEADIYVTSRDNFVWLLGYYKGQLPFDTIVIDELTSFKTPSSQRFKAMRIASPSAQRVIGLTGTPAPNGLVDLWAQMYCLDGGERLGKSVTKYRDTYFHQHEWNHIVVRCTPKKGAADAIQDKISDICLSMQAKDYIQLPSLMIHEVRIELSPSVRAAYEQFERDRIMEFNEAHSGEDNAVLANSVAGLMNKLSQFSNGAVYDEERNIHEIHKEKLEKLLEIVEAANGNNILVFYQYKHDAERITKALKGYKVATYEGEKTLNDWNAGKIDVLLAHPASTAFGLNMQEGGHYIVWFGTGWNLELYLQANARLHRQGQKYPVTVYKLICANTVDERANMALTNKSTVQQALMDGLKYLMNKHQCAEE